MAVTAKNIARHELIGLKIEVFRAKNKSLEGIKGKIVDETKNTLLIEQKKGKLKKLLKNQIIIRTHINNKTIQIDGRILTSRPEERIKKLKKIIK